MSDNVPAYQRRGSGLGRRQIMQELVQQSGGLDPDLWVVMDQRDNTLIEEEILHGAGSSKYVYEFSMSGTKVAGISVIGARELAAAYGGIQHSLIGSIAKTGKLFVMKSYPHGGQSMGLFVQVIPELADEPDYYEVVAEVKDVKTGNVVQIERKEFRLERRARETLASNPGLPEWYERPHYQTIASSKAYRNGVLSIIPQHVQLAWKQEMLALKKTDIITGSLLDEKRSGVLRYAAARAIGLDRSAVEALTLDQIMGLADAAREGKLEQFVQSGEALGIVIGAEEPVARKSVQVAAPVEPKATQRQATNGAAPPTGQGAERQPEKQAERQPDKPPAKLAAEKPKAEPVKQEPKPPVEPELVFEPVDEFGNPAVDSAGQPLRFTAPQMFALWYNERFFASDFPQALQENNEDAVAEARKDPAAAVLIQATEAKPEAAPPEQPAATPPAEETPAPAAPGRRPVELGTVAKTKRPNWAKYVVDAEADLKTVKTEAELDEWLAANRPTYEGKTAAYGLKIEGNIEARRAEIAKESAAPKVDRDMEWAKRLVEDLNAVSRQPDYDAIVKNPAVRSVCQRLATERPDITAILGEAEKAAVARIKAGIASRAAPAQAPPPAAEEPPFPGDEPPIGEDDMPPWERGEPS